LGHFILFLVVSSIQRLEGFPIGRSADAPTPPPGHEGFGIGFVFFLVGQVLQAKVVCEDGGLLVFVVYSFLCLDLLSA